MKRLFFIFCHSSVGRCGLAAPTIAAGAHAGKMPALPCDESALRGRSALPR
jgi:hypothetical protein